MPIEKKVKGEKMHPDDYVEGQVSSTRHKAEMAAGKYKPKPKPKPKASPVAAKPVVSDKATVEKKN